MVVSVIRRGTGLSPAKLRFLLLVFLASWIIPAYSHFIGPKVAPAAREGPLYSYYGTKGPWLGKATGAGWVHEDGPPQTAFKPGDIVSWDANATILAGSTSSGEATLWCGGHPIYVQDFHIYAAERRSGWKTFAMELPADVPPGDCGIKRQGEIYGPNGEHQTSEAPIIHIRVVPK